MTRKGTRKHMTLSEHLALRAQATEESRAQEVARLHTIQRLKELDAQVQCTCPACVRLRQMQGSSTGRQTQQTP